MQNLAESQLQELLNGVKRYQEVVYTRPRANAAVIWRRGAARLLAYYPDVPWKGEGAAPTVFFVPSLINRYYILNLAPGRSIVRHLTALGIQVIVLDWGAPGEEEQGFNCANYVTERLLPALDFIHRTAGAMTLGGYCMGGVLALAAAQLRPDAVERLALLATPWDFHADDVPIPRLDSAMQQQVERWLSREPCLSPHYLQMMFYWSDPWLFAEKYRRFAGLSEGGQAYREFVALEHWVNDGVPLAGKVAEECILGWGQQNDLVSGKWKVEGEVIRPKSIKTEIFIAMPRHDQVVPRGCAMGLAKEFPEATLCSPETGHVGMMVSSRAKKQLWEPFSNWLNRNA